MKRISGGVTVSYERRSSVRDDPRSRDLLKPINRVVLLPARPELLISALCAEHDDEVRLTFFRVAADERSPSPRVLRRTEAALRTLQHASHPTAARRGLNPVTSEPAETAS